MCPSSTACCGPQAEGAAGGQLVGVAAAEGGADLAAAQQPDDLRARARCSARSAKATSAVSAECPLPATAMRLPAYRARTAGSSRSGPGSAIRSAAALLAERGQAVAAERVGRRPGAGGVDDRPGGDPLLAAVGVAHVHGERLGVAAGVDDPVAAAAGDADDPGAEADPVAERVGQRLQVAARPSRAPVG